MDGLDFKGFSNHEGGMAAMLTGGGGATSESRGMSVDQFVASQLASDTRFASLELGVQTSAWGAGVQTRMSYTGAGTFASPVDDPAEVMRRIFGSTPTAPGETDPVALGRMSILDNVRTEVNAIRSRAPVGERAKLDVHLDAIRSMERSLSAAGGGAACSAPVLGSFDPYANASFPTVGKAQMDLLVAALACDATRVASIQWAHTVAPHVFSWTGTSEAHHSLSHMDDGNTAGVAAFVAAERWFTEQFKYLPDRLAAMPEGSGTMLDNTLIYMFAEIGEGAWHTSRTTKINFDNVNPPAPFAYMPITLIGGGGGAIKTGQIVRVNNDPNPQQTGDTLDRPAGDIYLAICRAMGVEVASFGNATTPLTEILA